MSLGVSSSKIAKVPFMKLASPIERCLTGVVPLNFSSKKENNSEPSYMLGSNMALYRTLAL